MVTLLTRDLGAHRPARSTIACATMPALNHAGSGRSATANPATARILWMAFKKGSALSAKHLPRLSHSGCNVLGSVYLSS